MLNSRSRSHYISTKISSLRYQLFQLGQERMKLEEKKYAPRRLALVKARIESIKKKLGSHENSYENMVPDDSNFRSSQRSTLSVTSTASEYFLDNEEFIQPKSDTNKIFWLIPLLGTFACTAELATGVGELADGENPLFGFIPVTPAGGNLLLFLVPFTYFIQLLNENAIYTFTGIKVMLDLIRNGHFPDYTAEEREEWPFLSGYQERKALISGLLFILFPAFANAIATFYFINKLPEIYGFSDDINLSGWKGFAVFTAIARSFETVLKEGPEIYRPIRKLYHSPHENNDPIVNEEKTCSQKYVPKIAGWFFGLVGAFNNAIECFFTIAVVFTIKSLPVKWVIFVLSGIFSGISDGLFSGQMTVDALNEFMDKLHGKISRSDVVAFAVTSVLSLFVAESMRQLMVSMLNDPDVSLPFLMPQALITVIGVITACREMINSVYMNFSTIKELPSKIPTSCAEVKDRVNSVVGFFKSCCAKKNDNANLVIINPAPGYGAFFADQVPPPNSPIPPPGSPRPPQWGVSGGRNNPSGSAPMLRQYR